VAESVPQSAQLCGGVLFHGYKCFYIFNLFRLLALSCLLSVSTPESISVGTRAMGQCLRLSQWLVPWSSVADRGFVGLIQWARHSISVGGCSVVSVLRKFISFGRRIGVGHVRERVRLYYRGRSVGVDALIDTGATMLVLPKRVAEELGVEALGEVEVELADGTVRGVPYGVVEVELSGRRAPVLAAIVEGGEVCVGVEVLERLGLAVDPASGRIYPTRRFVTRL